MKRIRLGAASALAAGALVCGALGCVSTKTHQAALAERDGLARSRAELEQQLRALEHTQEELAGQLAAKDAQLSNVQGTYDALVKDLKSELASGQVQIEQLRDGIRVQLAQEILFPSGSAELDARGAEVLGKVAKQMVSSPHRVEVKGHTDNVPITGGLAQRYPTNWELAAARAARVVRLFQEAGMEGTRLRAVSRSEYEPVATNDTEEGREKNRRIEVRLIPAEGASESAAAPSGEPPVAAAAAAEL
jgi:chemotaxis protein MotB